MLLNRSRPVLSFATLLAVAVFVRPVAVPPDSSVVLAAQDPTPTAMATDELTPPPPPTDEPTPPPASPTFDLPIDPSPPTIWLPLVFRATQLDELPAPATAPARTATSVPTPSETSPPIPSSTSSPTPFPTPVSTAPLPDECESPLENGDFDARGAYGWLEETEPGESMIIPEAARSGTKGARLGAWLNHEEVLLSEVAVPTFRRGESVVTLRWWMRITTEEATDDGRVGDRMLVVLVGDLPEAIELMFTYDEERWPPEGSELGADGWAEVTLELTEGYWTTEDFEEATVAFVSVPDGDDAPTVFDLDDVRLEICDPPSSSE